MTANPGQCPACGFRIRDAEKGCDVCAHDAERFSTCSGCGSVGDDVQERYSFGIYAGRLCLKCCGKYRDNCGEGRDQGRVEELDEFQRGGYDAIDGEEGSLLV